MKGHNNNNNNNGEKKKNKPCSLCSEENKRASAPVLEEDLWQIVS